MCSWAVTYPLGIAFIMTIFVAKDLHVNYATNITRIITCNGEALTLNCTLNSDFHLWNITALDNGQELLVNRFQRNLFNLRYNVSIVVDSTETGSIVSAVTILIDDDLNDTIILCQDAFDMQVIQMTKVTVIGKNNVL